MTMLSSSTPDLREDSGSSLVVSSSEGRNAAGIGPEASSRGGPIKDVIPRPGSAPATKFSDCDSAFEEGGEVDPGSDLGDIFSVLSIDNDSKIYKTEKTQDKGTNSVKSLENVGQVTDRNQEAHDQVISCQRFESGTLGVFGSNISAIAEVSGEDSDNSHRSSRVSKPSRDADGNPPSSLSGPAEAFLGNNLTVKFKPRQIQCLQTPLVYISTSDDTSSDSNDDMTTFRLPALRRNSGAYRRRHSLASTTPDQITRMLLSHRRGSSSGLPIPCVDCFHTMHLKSQCNHARKPMEKQRSVDSVRRMHQSVRSTTTRPDSRPLVPRVAQSPQGLSEGQTLSRPKSPSVVMPRSISLSTSTHLRPVSPDPANNTGSDSVPRIVSPRPSSPCAVYPSSANLAPRMISPGPQSPRPRSPGLYRQRSVSPRDETEMILSRTPPGTPPQTPPRSSSPRPPQPSSSSTSLAFSSQDDQRPRSPSSKLMLPVVHCHGSDNAPTHPRTRSRSPRPKHERYDRSAKLYTNNIGEPTTRIRKDPQKTQSTSGNTLAVHDKPNRPRSRSPVPLSLKPDPQNASAHPQRDRSPRPTGHERRSSRHRSSLAATAIKSEPSTLCHDSRRPSRNSNAPDASDESNLDLEIFLMDRRRRRGSRGKTFAIPSTHHAASSARQSRRSSICISHPTKEMPPPGTDERADITAKLSKRGRRRSSWAGAGERLLPMTPVSALTLLKEGNRNVEEETELTRDPYVLTLHFITDPGQSHPLRKILRPLIESIVPKLKLFNFVERSESATRELQAGDLSVSDREKPAMVPTLGVVLLLQEEFGMERILEAQKYLRSEPWELHHRGKVGSNNVPYPTNNQDFYAHQTRLDSALWAVRQVHFGKDRLRFQLFVSDEMWADSISFYALLLSRPTHVQKDDFCYFLVFCSHSLNLEVQLALKKLPPGFKPQFLDSTILQFKVGDMGQLVPLMPRVCIPISDKRWQTADPDGNKVLLFKDGDSLTTPITPTTSDPPDATSPPPSSKTTYSTVGPLSRRDRESPGHQFQDHAGHFDEWMQESSLVSAV